MHRHRCQNRMFYVDNTASIIARLSAQYGVCMFCACQNAISRMGVSENGYCACVALVCMCEIEKLSVRCRTQYFVLFFFSFLDKIRITWNRSSTGQDSFSRNSHAKINGWMQKLHAKTDGRSQIYFRERHAIAISSVYFAVILCVIVTIRWMLTTYSIQRCNTTDDREKKTATFASIGHWMRVYVTAPTTTKCAYSRQTEWIAWIYMYIFIIIRVWKLHWGIGLHWAISHLQRQAQSKSSNAHICTLFLCCFSIPLEDPSLSLSLPF